MRGITKAFPGCLANDRIDLTVRSGEIHALLGENGAGKSTLVKIMSGVLWPDSGEVLWQGEPLRLSGPAEARRRGIAMVFQHFSLFEALTVIENVSLAMGPEWKMSRLREELEAVSAAYGLPLSPDRAVQSLSVGERQRIEIVRCLLLKPSLLILDEPTSVLTPQEAEKLFETLRQLAAEGCAILYISHKLAEVRALCDRATVLRDGKVVAACDPRIETPGSLAEMMIGDKVSPAQRTRTEMNGDVRLSVSLDYVSSLEELGVDLSSVRFDVRGGEILGIAGVAGNGQAELMAALSGERPITSSDGTIAINTQSVGRYGPPERRKFGAAFVPEERNGHGAVRELTLSDNGALTALERLKLVVRGLMRQRPIADFARTVISSYDVRTTGSDATAGGLSGGNLQKFMVGREISQTPSVLVISQPTWGVDAGAAATIHRALIKLAAEGAAVVVISQDLDEIFAICDRVAVISEGRLSKVYDVGEMDAEGVGMLMGGLHDSTAQPANAIVEAVGREATHAH
ncbi:MAG: ABC transporter ATP-binding protein [Pseudomonadota bacterium]